LEQLVESGLIKPELAKEQVQGYVFSLALKDSGFELHAVPAHYTKGVSFSGTRGESFYGDEKGVVYGAEKDGKRATSTDAEMLCSNGQFEKARPGSGGIDNKKGILDNAH
jgi:hypothetical protein